MQPMKRWFALTLLAVVLPLRAAEPEPVPPGDFTAEYAVVLSAAEPKAEVGIVKPLELKVTMPERGEFSLYLDNAYQAYRQQPDARRDVIARFVAAALETIRWENAPIDAARVVPVVKDRAWVSEAEKLARAKGFGDVTTYVVEDLSRELVVLYAEDSPRNIRYLTSKDLEKLAIRKDLRASALANLRRLLPEIEIFGGNGYYMVSAGGNYEASLLLFDSFWRDDRFRVKGDLVVAVPVRGSLLVTGSDDRRGLAKTRDMVRRIFTKQPYPLTQSLFVRRDGKLVEFEAAASP